MNNQDTAREAIARIIDPSSWRVFDHELERVKRHHPNGGYDPDSFTDRASLAKADLILPIIAALTTPDQPEIRALMEAVEPFRQAALELPATSDEREFISFAVNTFNGRMLFGQARVSDFRRLSQAHAAVKAMEGGKT